MPTTDTCLDRPPSFAQEAVPSLAEQADRQARETAQLRRQISLKAPQLASVLDMLDEAGPGGRIEFAERPPAFFAPLLRRCREFLRSQPIKKRKQA